MPKINTNNPKVRKYFVDICANWVENYGIDGIRLDVANEVSHRFCKELHARVKEINPISIFSEKFGTTRFRGCAEMSLMR